MTALVSILITAHNRPDELRRTLRELRAQDYSLVELVVVDDNSDVPLETLVKSEWPLATVVRNEQNIGYIASRSFGMKIASGDYILSLDDDSCLTNPIDISRAVARISASPEIGILNFFVVHGNELDNCASQGQERLSHTFIGCGHMIRKELVNSIGGYRDFYEYYAEEHEYALRALNAGWKILFFPTVVVHHRFSTLGRQAGRIWAYSLRNNLWTILLHMPTRKLLLEVAWKTAVGTAEAFRLFKPQWFAWAIASTVYGLPNVLALRSPISNKTSQLYDWLRFCPNGLTAESVKPGAVSLRQKGRWFLKRWLHRRRSRPWWDRRRGGIGSASGARFTQ